MEELSLRSEAICSKWWWLLRSVRIHSPFWDAVLLCEDSLFLRKNKWFIQYINFKSFFISRPEFYMDLTHVLLPTAPSISIEKNVCVHPLSSWEFIFFICCSWMRLRTLEAGHLKASLLQSDISPERSPAHGLILRMGQWKQINCGTA